MTAGNPFPAIEGRVSSPRRPFLLDSARPRIPLSECTRHPLRSTTLARTDPAEAERLAALAQHAVDLRGESYEEMVPRPAHSFAADARPGC